jgi:hypothetical protein
MGERMSYDEIMSMLEASGRRNEETDRRNEEARRRNEETGRLIQKIAERQRETNEQMKKTDERLDKLCKQVGGISENIGHHAEQFFQDAFATTLTFGGEKYDYMDPNVTRKKGNDGVELDILLLNGKSVAIIEAKNRIHPVDVKTLAEVKLAKFRTFFTEYQNHKVYLGLAGFSFSKTVIELAQKYGMGVAKQVGESIEVEADHLKAY